MEKLDKVELVREKCDVSYEEARNALEQCDYDVLDAIVMLEREGKAQGKTVAYATKSEPQGNVSPEMQMAQSAYQEQSKKTKLGEAWAKFCTQFKALVRAGLDMTFIAERNAERVVAVPLLFVVLGLMFWGASLWLLILGLFFGFRYRIEGANPLTIDVNDAMDKAADVAETIKSDFANKNE